MPGTDLTSLAAYVKARGGRRVLSKILIANNGIAAVKAIRSIRQWAYEVFGNEREVRSRALQERSTSDTRDYSCYC